MRVCSSLRGCKRHRGNNRKYMANISDITNIETCVVGKPQCIPLYLALKLSM